MFGRIILYFLLFLAGVAVLIYNTIVRRRNDTDNAFAGIDAYLKKRYDLIPNLVETVKQYMKHESEILNELTALRTGYQTKLSTEQKVELHNQIRSKLAEVLYQVENYPELKASSSFLHLQSSWNELEEQISAARRYYNTAVTDYNNAIQTFPSNLIARAFHFNPKQVLEIESAERIAPKASLLFQ